MVGGKTCGQLCKSPKSEGRARSAIFIFCGVWAMLHPKEEQAFVLCQSIYQEGVRKCARLNAEQPGYLARSEWAANRAVV